MKNHEELKERFDKFINNFTIEDWKNYKQQGELDHPESDEVTILGETFKTNTDKPKKLEGLEVEYRYFDEVSYISPEVYEKLKGSNELVQDVLDNAIVTSVGGEGFITPDKEEEYVKGNKYDKMLNKLKEALEKETPESYNAWFDKIDEFEENIKSRMESGTLDINELNKEYEEFFKYKK